MRNPRAEVALKSPMSSRKYLHLVPELCSFISGRSQVAHGLSMCEHFSGSQRCVTTGSLLKGNHVLPEQHHHFHHPWSPLNYKSTPFYLFPQTWLSPEERWKIYSKAFPVCYDRHICQIISVITPTDLVTQTQVWMYHEMKPNCYFWLGLWPFSVDGSKGIRIGTAWNGTKVKFGFHIWMFCWTSTHFQ